MGSIEVQENLRTKGKPPEGRRSIGSVARLTSKLVLSLVLVSCGAGSPERIEDRASERDAELPNVVLISIDTLRADRLSAYGHDRPTSPTLERLAARGVIAERFYYAGGGTLPSHLTMLTSLGVLTHGIDTDSQRRLEPERVTLAEQLRDAGYETAAFVDGGWMNRKFGFDQGFRLYDDGGGGFERILPKAIAWLRQQSPERPVFLFLHSYDTHSQWERRPYDCPGDYALSFVQEEVFDGCRESLCASELLATVNQSIREGRQSTQEAFTEEEVDYMMGLYDGCIQYVDERIARLLEALERMGHLTNSLVIVTSDHGEEFGEHGLFLHDQPGHEEIARIPFIMKLPDDARAGTRLEALASTLDVMPTVLDIVGLEPNRDVEGRSLMTLLDRTRPAEDRVDMGRSYRRGDWKLIQPLKALYDLEADPLEAKNLWALEPERRDPLLEELRSIVAQKERARVSFADELSEPRIVPELDESEKAQLRALGYLTN